MESEACDLAFRRISRDHEEVTVNVRSMTETKGDWQCPLDRVQIGGTPVQQAELRALLRRYADVFAVREEDLGYTDRVKHEVPVTDDVLVTQAYRRIPPNQFKEVREHITRLLKEIIKESSSPYASPVVLVRKTDGSLWLCIYYRKLNSKTQRDAFPLPRIDESLDALCNAQVFSTIDLASGYHQVAMHEKDQYKTAFVTPFGLYEYVRMPFGLYNAPATFQRLMQAVMGDLVFQMVLVYLDDLLVYSSSFEAHLSRLETELCRLREAGFKIFSKVAGPLHDVVNLCTKKGSGSQCDKLFQDSWTSECQQVFEHIKKELTCAPVLGYADFSLPFVLETDAIHLGLGAVLFQLQDGRKKVIAYASRRLRGAECNDRNYSSMKLELLVLKWAEVEKYRGYLLGSRFTVLTDSNPLCHLNTAKLGAVEQRWAAQLVVFNFEICYRPGRYNTAADALSRRPGLEEVEVVVEDTEYDGCVAICSEQHGGTAIDPDLTVLGPALGELAEGKVSPDSALGNTPTLPGYIKEELCRLQDADPFVKLLKQFWHTRRKPSARERRGLPRQVRSLLKQWGKIKEEEGLFYCVVDDVFLGECQQLLLPTCLCRCC